MISWYSNNWSKWRVKCQRSRLISYIVWPDITRWTAWFQPGVWCIETTFHVHNNVLWWVATYHSVNEEIVRCDCGNDIMSNGNIESKSRCTNTWRQLHRDHIPLALSRSSSKSNLQSKVRNTKDDLKLL